MLKVVTHLRAARIANAELLTNMLYALVCQILLAVHQIADLSALLALNVHKIVLASIKNA